MLFVENLNIENEWTEREISLPNVERISDTMWQRRLIFSDIWTNQPDIRPPMEQEDNLHNVGENIWGIRLVYWQYTFSCLKSDVFTYRKQLRRRRKIRSVLLNRNRKGTGIKWDCNSFYKNYTYKTFSKLFYSYLNHI